MSAVMGMAGSPPVVERKQPTFDNPLPPKSKQEQYDEFMQLQPLRAMGAFNDILGAAGGFTGNVGSRDPAHYPQASQSSTRVTPVAPASKGARANPVPSEMKQGLEASRTPAFKAKQAEEAQRVADRDATIQRNRAMVDNEKELRNRPREWRETNDAYKARQAAANDKTEVVARPAQRGPSGTEVSSRPTRQPTTPRKPTAADWAEKAYEINKSLGRPTGEEDFTKGRSGSVRDTEYAPGKTQMLDQGVRDGSTTGVRGPLKQPHPGQAQVRQTQEAQRQNKKERAAARKAIEEFKATRIEDLPPARRIVPMMTNEQLREFNQIPQEADAKKTTSQHILQEAANIAMGNQKRLAREKEDKRMKAVIEAEALFQKQKDKK